MSGRSENIMVSGFSKKRVKRWLMFACGSSLVAGLVGMVYCKHLNWDTTSSEAENTSYSEEQNTMNAQRGKITSALARSSSYVTYVKPHSLSFPAQRPGSHL